MAMAQTEAPKSLKVITVKNIGFVYISMAFAKLLGLVSTMVLAWLLVPSDFGLIAISGTITGLIAQFADFGIGTALVQRHEQVKDASNAAFYMYILIGILLYVAAFFIAPWAAFFFNEPDVAQIVRISALSFVISPFGDVHRLLLRKELKFKKITIVEVITTVTYTVSAVILAFLGFSFWSIVYGSIISNVIAVLVFWCVYSWIPKLTFEKQIAKELFSFGKYVFASGIILFLYTSIGNLVGGKLLGVTILGYYFMAFKFGNYSTILITHVVGRVMFPTFSVIQNDKERLKLAYLKILKHVSMLSIPLAIGLFVIAPEFVKTILPERYEPVIPILQILCFYGLFRSLNAGAGTVFLAVGKPQIGTKIWGIALVFVLILIYPMTILFKINGLATLMTLGILINTILQLITICKILKFPYTSQIKLFIAPLLSSLLMLIVIYMAKYFLINNIFSFILLILTGITSYTISLYMTTRGGLVEDIKEIMSAIRS